MRTAAAAACLLSAAAATRARALQVTTQLEMYTSRNCSEGTLNATIDLAARNESLCTQCWDRCAEEGTTGFPSMRLRGPGKVAIQGNCAGKFAYAGGWSDDLEVIVSGACGVMGPVVVDGRPRPLPGGQRSSNLPGGTLGAAVSGLRLVCVTRGAIGHRWFTHGAVPEQLDVAASAHKWPREGRPELRRARRAGRRPEAKL